MRAFIVSVDYTDLLEVTLAYNRHHFSEVYIITSSKDAPNVNPVADKNHASVIVTDLFYENGATFNKWAALEHGLDVAGREGQICLMDADTLWPKLAPVPIRSGYLITPYRRMHEDTSKPIPHEAAWELLPIHQNVNEFAGYSQIFMGDDPHLGNPPWHQIDWVHAGGADSFFQQKWPLHRKIRPQWECLHLGPAGKNWYGRSTPYLDGTLPENAEERKRLTEKLWSGRRRRQSGPDRFSNEKIL